jgi:heat shock protein HslJ
MKIVIWILFFGLSGCQNADTSKQLTTTKWTLLGLQNSNTRSYESVPAEYSGMSISFNKARRFQATSSCNTIYGYYFISRNSIKIDSLSMTKMFCIDSLQTAWEDKYIAGLKSSSEYEITKDTLSIKTNSNSKLIFKAELQKAESEKQK